MKSAGETLFLFDKLFQNYHSIERQRPYMTQYKLLNLPLFFSTPEKL